MSTVRAVSGRGVERGGAGQGRAGTDSHVALRAGVFLGERRRAAEWRGCGARREGCCWEADLGEGGWQGMAESCAGWEARAVCSDC